MELEAVTAAVCAELPGLWALYLYGSQVRDFRLPGADVDLAVLAAEPLDREELWRVAEKVASIVHADVDLVDLRQVPLPLRVEAVFRGKLLFDGNPPQRRAFEGHTLASYVRLNEERRPVLDRIRREGRIYG